MGRCKHGKGAVEAAAPAAPRAQDRLVGYMDKVGQVVTDCNQNCTAFTGSVGQVLGSYRRNRGEFRRGVAVAL